MKIGKDKNLYVAIITDEEIQMIGKLRSGEYHIRRNPPKGRKRGVKPSDESNLVHSNPLTEQVVSEVVDG